MQDSTPPFTLHSSLLDFFDHANRLGGAFFGANPTALAVLEVNFDGNGALDHRIRTIEPADVA